MSYQGIKYKGLICMWTSTDTEGIVRVLTRDQGVNVLDVSGVSL